MTNEEAKEILKAEAAQSLLVKLPCLTGTTIYYVYTLDEDNKILDVGKIISFSIEDDALWAFAL